MIGTFEEFELTFGSFGQQYRTIDGRVYLTWFDAADPTLRGLSPGVKVEYEARPGPTALCHSPRVREDLPSGVLLRMSKESA
ncbi:MAG TPA: hypothetical protein VNZ64_02300 [Candidatus Acidoferrum sp.]|jgi:hypothetical protein|nr:hypothetical protein [Candidatus Acidoferrum sp.]